MEFGHEQCVSDGERRVVHEENVVWMRSCPVCVRALIVGSRFGIEWHEFQASKRIDEHRYRVL